MRSKLILMPALAVFCGATAWGQQPAPPKLAVIDMQSALLGTKDGQKAVADFKAKFAPKQDEFQKRQADLQAKQQQLAKTQNTLSDEAKAAQEADIARITKDLTRDTQDAQQDAQEEQQKLLNELGGRIMQVIQKYSIDNKITMVFDVTQGNQGNNLLFAAPSTDITRDIIALYDQLSSAAPPAASKPAAPATSSTPAAPSAVRRPAAPAAPATTPTPAPAK